MPSNRLKQANWKSGARSQPVPQPLRGNQDQALTQFTEMTNSVLQQMQLRQTELLQRLELLERAND